MAIDPKTFKDVAERLGISIPSRGTPILAKNREGHIIAGNVGNIWMGVCGLCVDVDTVGGTARIYPELGDQFKTWKE